MAQRLLLATRHSRLEPLQRSSARRSTRSKRRLQQIAAGRGFPVQHLAGGEDAGQAAEHEVGIEVVEGNAACGRDRAGDRRNAGEFDRNGVDQMGEIGRRSRRIIEQEFPNVVWVHSHVAVEDDGNVRTICLYDAPDLDAIHQHAQMLGYHVVDGVFEVAGDVTPADFPETGEPDLLP